MQFPVRRRAERFARRAAALLIGLIAAVAAPASQACVGTDCLELFSTAEGGGALTISWDFANRKVQTFRSVCISGQCLYSAIDPGFMTPAGPPPEGFHRLADGTTVDLEIVTIDPAATLKIDGVPLSTSGAATVLGTAPTLHTHPSWQLHLPDGERGDYPIAFKLATDSSTYADSEVFQVVLTNQAPPTPDAPTPTATPTVAHRSCPGDCDGNGAVAVNELVSGVLAALGAGSTCEAACDLNGDGAVTVSELVTAVNAALSGCPAPATPTATVAAAFAAIQQAVFSPRCAVPTCHDAFSKAGSLALDADESYDQLVGVTPSVDTARQAGMLRVDPSRPENSFLLVKLAGPPPDQGGRMPLGGPYLAPEELQLVGDWIAQGAPR